MTAPYQPSWSTPAAPGEVSAKRGSNTGADALSLVFKSGTVRGSGDLLSSCRLTAVKAGSTTSILDTWWMGPGAAGAVSPVADVRPNCVFTYNGRVYVKKWNGAGPTAAGTTGDLIYSTTINGPNIGSVWRAETIPPLALTKISAVATYGMCQVNGFVYLVTGTGTASIYYAPIRSDGSFGTWANSGNGNTGSSAGPHIFGFTDGSGSYLFWLASETGAATRGCKLNADGSAGTTIVGGALSGNCAHCGVHFVASGLSDGNGTLWVIGGYDGTNPIATVRSAPVTGGNATIGAWANAATGLPAARSNFGFAVHTIAGATWLYAVGGSNAGAPTANATTTIYRITAANLGAAWTTDATALGVAQVGGGVAQQASGAVTGGSAANQGEPTQTSFTGAQTVTLIQINGSTAVVTSVTGSQGAGAIASADLGTGGSVVTNGDGTQTITYVWGAVAPIGGAGLADGDVVIVTAYVCDQQGGDLGPVASTAFKIGQAPTITSLSPASGATGGACDPTVSFGYTAGVGCGAQLAYQIQIKSGATVLFDSGVLYDGLNNATALLAPFLTPNTAYTLVVNVWAQDNDFTGALVKTTSTTTFTTVNVALPATPTGFTATPNNAGGYIALAWTNPSPPASPGNRVYYRRNGTSQWYLLYDPRIAATAYNAMDQIALGIAYDFAVTQVNLGANMLESAQATALNVKVDHVAGGYAAMLHLAGNGTTYFAPLGTDNPAQMAQHYITKRRLAFGKLAPVATFGVAAYHDFTLSVWVTTLANHKQIMAVLSQAATGSTLYYRDGFGALVAVTTADSPAVQYDPATYRRVALPLIQAPNTFSPSTAVGSALGYLAQQYGSVTPLDTSELLI